MFHKHPELFEDPKIQDPIDDLNLNFSEYINKTRNIISTYRRDLNKNSDLIIESNTPFEFKSQYPIYSKEHPTKLKKGVLLIHGLLDTSFLMQDIGKSLQNQGFLIRSILLPGHGTVPGALLNVTYEDWLKAVRYGVASLKKEVDEIYLAGFSTGASLSVYHTVTDPAQIAGIILLAPAFKIKSFFDFVLNWNRSLSWQWKRANWFHITAEDDYTKYQSVPFNAIYQVYRLSQALKKMKHNNKPACPILMTISYDDLIVCSLTSIQYFLQHPNPASRMILYTSAPHDYNDPRILIRNSSLPEWKILNFSHVSIPVAPTNFHYGIEGDYHLASHVKEKNNYLYGALNKSKKIFYDTLYKLKLTPYIRKRLSFNPDFDFMMKQIVEFIQQK